MYFTYFHLFNHLREPVRARVLTIPFDSCGTEARGGNVTCLDPPVSMWCRGHWNPGSVAPELRTKIQGIPSPFYGIPNTTVNK